MSGQVLKGEIALVTGASRGIGAAIADELVALGATVIGTATSDAGANVAASEEPRRRRRRGRRGGRRRSGRRDGNVETPPPAPTED